jgi:site-specific recombinase XerD
MRVHSARRQYIRWLRVARDLSPHTIRAYDGDIETFERHVGMRAQVGRIDQECVIAFVERSRAAGLSAVSIKRRMSAIRGFCNWLSAQQLLDQDPLSGVGSLSSGPRRRVLPRTVPAHELDALFSSLRNAAGLKHVSSASAVLARPHESTTLLATSLMVVTGARVSEIVSIRCADLDLPNRSLRILGKGRRERQVFLANQWVADLTQSYVHARRTLDPAHAQLLFNSRYEPLTASAMRIRLAKAADTAGLRIKVTPHMLRHTAATRLIEAGVDIRYIQRLLGHASLTTTEIYTHVSDEALRRVVTDADVLEKLLR